MKTGKEVRKSVIVLGAGLTGLSYAYKELNSGSPVLIVEKEDTVGGLARSYIYGKFVFDIGPHIFRSKDEKILSFVKNLLEGNYHHVSSNPAIYKYGKLFDNVVPVITYRNLELLEPSKRERVEKELGSLNKKLDLSNFESCIISQVGETLYWEFFGEYSRKWWGLDPRVLSSDLAPKNLRIDREKSYGHITTNFESVFEEIYPVKGGILEIAKRLSMRISLLGGKIMLSSNVKSLEADGDEIARIVIEKDGEEIEVDSKDSHVISTIPLNILCKMLRISFDLLYRGNMCVFIKMRGSKLYRFSEFSWVYFHDSDVIFSRVHEPAYYSEFNTPKNHTSLVAEVTYFEDTLSQSHSNIADKVVEQLIDLGVIKGQDPEVLGIAREPYAYPVYTVDYRQKLARVFERLSEYKNLRILGRTGSFSYQNMHECLRWAVY